MGDEANYQGPVGKREAWLKFGQAKAEGKKIGNREHLVNVDS